MGRFKGECVFTMLRGPLKTGTDLDTLRACYLMEEEALSRLAAPLFVLQAAYGCIVSSSAAL